MQKVVGKKAAKRIKVVGKMYLSNKSEEVFLKKGFAIRDVAKLTRKGISTIQRVKKQFCKEVFLPFVFLYKTELNNFF